MAAKACLMLLLFTLHISVVQSTEVDLQKRIIGGHECERQYHVKLRGVAVDGSSSLCGGSLISSQWVLTAAHCLKPGKTMFADVIMHPGDSAQEMEITAEPVIYTDKDINKVRFHDIALLRLPSTSDIHPVNLPECGERPEIVEIAGHAATTGDADDIRKPGKAATLHCADVEVVGCEDLQNTLRENFQTVYKVKKYQHWFCGQTPGVDICFGDSGGGVVHGDKIYGVISFLGDPKYVCRKAAAFMDLCNPEYSAWIKKTIN